MVQIFGYLHLIRELVIFVHDEEYGDNCTEEPTDIRQGFVDFFEGACYGQRKGRFADIEF